MNVPLTFAAFVVLTGILVLLRFLWPSLPYWLRLFLIAMVCAVPVILAIAFVTQWSTTSQRLNAAFYWLGIASYEFFLVLFTRLRPRWLTSIIAIILILPLLSASVFLPLTQLFNPPPSTTAVLGDGFISQRRLWGSGTAHTSGTDLFIYYQPSWIPFLVRTRLSARYYGGQCNAWDAYAVVQPDHRSALMVCPAWPGQPAESAHRIILPFK